MANNFSGDSRVKALWKFDGDLNDASGNGNHLADHNGITFVGTPKMEGVQSAYFNKSLTQYCNRADADLGSGFPFKSDDTVKNATFCGWFKFNSYGGYGNFFTKADWSGNKHCLWIQRDYAQIRVGYGTTASDWHEIKPYPWIQLNFGWYHVAVVIDGKTNKYVYFRVYEADTENIYQYQESMAGEIWVGDVPFFVSNEGALSQDNCIDGYADEIVVFNAILTDEEIDAIRDGTFSGLTPNVSIFQAGADLLYKEGMPGVQIAQAGLDLLCARQGTNEHRVFPVFPANRLRQSQAWKRNFPV